MSRTVNYDKLTEDDVEYLRQRNWLPQPTNEQLEALGLTPYSDDEDPSNVEVVSIGDQDDPVVDPGDEIIVDPYEGLSADDLRDLCRERGLNTSGTKPEMIERLEA